jgi:hypothetical protein
LARREGVPKETARCFDRDLVPELQMRLVRELVATRAAELTLAYRNVVMVAAGHKKRTDSRGRVRLTKRACVVFVVRDKWDRSRDARAGHQLLPKRLLAFATIGDRRVLCAVPTDVQHERDFYGVTPQSERAVYPYGGNPGDPTGEFGTLTCLVRVGQRRLVLSCRHVLSPKPEITSIASGKRFAQLLSPDSPPGGPDIGTSAAIAGPLLASPDISFDAQFGSFNISALPLLRALFKEMPLSPDAPYVTSVDEFDEMRASSNFEILVPDNHPDASMKPRPTYVASFDVYLDKVFSFPYPVRVNGASRTLRVSHWELLRFKIAANRTTLPGDSGSPIVAWNSNGTCTLVGMHIAATKGQAMSYVIPAWQLFAASNYLGLTAGTRIEPVNS